VGLTDYNIITIIIPTDSRLVGLPFGTPQNDKLRHLNYVILTK
jgi:hypothetical protein